MMKTEILLDQEPVADGGCLVRVILQLTGEGPTVADQTPLNLSVVLDLSGSMETLDTMAQVREALSLVLRRLGDRDTISVVASDRTGLAAVGPTAGSRHSERGNRVSASPPGRMTSLAKIWLQGFQLVTRSLVDGEVNRVLLLTDGLANAEYTDSDRLLDLVASAARSGVSTTTVGVGNEYDEVLLRSLADAGGGSTYYIEKPDQAPAVFETEIEGLMALTAQNVTVTVRPGQAVDAVTILHGYPRRELDDRCFRLDLGDLFAIEPKLVLFEFLVDHNRDSSERTTGSDDEPLDVALLTVDGGSPTSRGGARRRAASLPIRIAHAGKTLANRHVRRELLLLEAARVREEALDGRIRGRYQDAAHSLRTVAGKLARSAGSDLEVQDEMEDLLDLARRVEENELTLADTKWMYQRAYARTQGKPRTVARLVADRRGERRRQRM